MYVFIHIKIYTCIWGAPHPDATSWRPGRFVKASAAVAVLSPALEERPSFGFASGGALRELPNMEPVIYTYVYRSYSCKRIHRHSCVHVCVYIYIYMLIYVSRGCENYLDLQSTRHSGPSSLCFGTKAMASGSALRELPNIIGSYNITGSYKGDLRTHPRNQGLVRAVNDY